MISKTYRCIINIVFFLAGLILITSCLMEEVCDDINVMIRIGFYEDDPDNEDPLSVTIERLTVFGLGVDSLVYNNALSVGQIELPLASHQDSCAFVFRFPGNERNLVYDTIWFYYLRSPKLITMECGFVTFFQLLEIQHTTNNITTILTEDPEINDEFNEHVRIFP